MWALFPSKRLRERIEELETAVKLLRQDRKLLETEWEQVYEKYRVAMSKLARRDIREADQRAQDAPETTNARPVDLRPASSFFSSRR